MHIQRVISSKSEYRNSKQIQISNAQMIEEPHSKLRGMFCRAAEPTGSALAISVQEDQTAFSRGLYFSRELLYPSSSWNSVYTVYQHPNVPWFQIVSKASSVLIRFLQGFPLSTRGDADEKDQGKPDQKNIQAEQGDSKDERF